MKAEDAETKKTFLVRKRNSVTNDETKKQLYLETNHLKKEINALEARNRFLETRLKAVRSERESLQRKPGGEDTETLALKQRFRRVQDVIEELDRRLQECQHQKNQHFLDELSEKASNLRFELARLLQPVKVKPAQANIELQKQINAKKALVSKLRVV